MKSVWIARFVAGIALCALAGFALPTRAAAPPPHGPYFYYVDIPASGTLGPAPSAPLDNIPPPWIQVAGFSWGGDLTLEHDRAGSITITGWDPASAQTLYAAVGNRTQLPVLRLFVTQPNASGQQVPSEAIVVRDLLVTLGGGKGKSTGVGPSFSFNFDEAGYEFSAPDPANSGQLRWLPDLSRPTMTSVPPVIK